MFYVGLDVHQKQSTFCVLDENGKRLQTRTVRGHWDLVMLELAKLPKPFAVCFEASIGYGVLFQRLQRIATRVVVAHPGKLRLIFQCKRKNDRVDAEKLAKLVFLDEVPSVHVPSVDVQAWRRLIEHRSRMVAERTRIKNGLRALLRGQGIPSPRQLWSRRGLTWLRAQELLTPYDDLRRDLLLERLLDLSKMLKRLEHELNRIGAAHPGVQLLRSIPGVGARTAEAVVAYLDDVTRFRRSKQVGAYFGLVPCQDASARVNRLGHITRQGPATVRRLLTEATWQGIRRSPTLRSYYERIGQGNPERRKIALTATAHHVVRVMFALLRDGSFWKEDAQPARATG
jgi:transposase